MKASHVALFAATAYADGWLNWEGNNGGEKDVTVTQTVTNTHYTCPCDTKPTPAPGWQGWSEEPDCEDDVCDAEWQAWTSAGGDWSDWQEWQASGNTGGVAEWQSWKAGGGNNNSGGSQNWSQWQGSNNGGSNTNSGGSQNWNQWNGGDSSSTNTGGSQDWSQWQGNDDDSSAQDWSQWQGTDTSNNNGGSNWNQWNGNTGSSTGNTGGSQGWEQWEGGSGGSGWPSWYEQTTVCPYNGQCYVSTRTHTVGATITQTVCPASGSCALASATVGPITSTGPVETVTVCPHYNSCYVSTRTITASATITQTVCPTSGTCVTLTATVGPTSGSTSASATATTTTTPGATVGPSLTQTTGMTTMTTMVTTTPGTTVINTPISSTGPASTGPTVLPTSAGAPAAGQTQVVSLAGQSYIDAMLTAHNLHRRNHTVVDLVWDTDLETSARGLAQTCVYGHRTDIAGGQPYGQNIGAGLAPAQAPQLISNSMYNGEINNYPGPYGSDNVDTSNFAGWGHFSQIVWAATTKVGCYTQDCSATGLQNAPGIPPYFTVCNYNPQGNIVGAWSNVKASLNQGTIVVS